MGVNIEIIAIGKIASKSPISALCDEYKKRITWKLSVHEIADSTAGRAAKLIKPDAFKIVLDENGKSITSRDFAKTIDNQMGRTIQILIGGADGHDKATIDKADFLMSFGKQTWPHKFVRAMTIEQIYRAQQILSGHPYHRD